MSENKTPELYEDYLAWKGWESEINFGQNDRMTNIGFRKQLKGIVDCNQNGLRVLEIGFGQGKFLAFARDCSWDVTGLEINQDLVKIAQNTGFDAKYSESLKDMIDKSFDLIVAFDVLEHIPQPDIIPILQTLNKKLKAEGKIFLRFPNGDHWLGNIHQNGDPTHVTAIGYSKLTYFTAMAGLKVVLFRGARRPGFERGMFHGIHKLLTEPVKRAIATVQRLIYVPGLPIVLYRSDCVAVLRRETGV